MEITAFKCWDGEKHNWELQHASLPYHYVWCSKCGSTATLDRKYILGGKWKFTKNRDREPIFTPPSYFTLSRAEGDPS